MKWLIIAFRFLPILIEAAEHIFSKPKSGADKKQFVSKSIVSIAKGLEDISTGGQKSTWHEINKHSDVIGKAIDTTVDIMFNDSDDSMNSIGT